MQFKRFSRCGIPLNNDASSYDAEALDEARDVLLRA